MIRYRVADVYVCKQICTVCGIKINNTAAGSVPWEPSGWLYVHTHCVRPKSRRSSMNFVPAVFRVHLVVRRSVWRSSLREPSVSWTLIQQRQAKCAWSQRRKPLTGPAGGKRQNFSGQERVRRSNIRLPRFLDRVYVESQYKGHPVHTLGDLLRFLQVGPDERTKTLESRESCSLLSWFAAKFRKNRRLCFVGCPKEVALSSRICKQYCAHSIGKCSEMKGVHVVVVVRQYQCPGKRKRSKNWCGFQERPRRAPLLGIRWCSLGERLQQIPAGRRRTWGRCRYM